MSKSYLQRDHQTLRGRIHYTSRKPDRRDEERGRETFTIVKHGNGARTLYAHSEIDDRPSVLRLTQVSYDADWRPTDAAVRIVVGDQDTGSGWFRFTDTHIECEAITTHDGRISQRFEVEQPPPMFAAHAIQNDAYIYQLFDLGRQDETQRLPIFYASSPDHRGATGPLVCGLSCTVELAGEEIISVAAGRFEALHFCSKQVHGMPVEHPEYHLWVTADGDYTYLKGEISGYMQTAYELVELERS